MDNPFRLPRPTSPLGWLTLPVRWALWRINKPIFDRAAAAYAGVASLENLWALANYTRTHADNVHGLVRDQQGRVDELVHISNYVRTHADNILGLVRDAHTRCDALEARANELARQLDAVRTGALSPLAISPLMAQAITLDHVALTRRIGMIESLLVDLQAGDEPAVLSLAAHRPAA